MKSTIRVSCTYLLLALCFLSTTQAAADEPASLKQARKYLPDDFDVLATMNVDQILDSRFWQKAEESIPNFAKQFEDFERLSNVSTIHMCIALNGDSLVRVVQLHEPIAQQQLMVRMNLDNFREVEVAGRILYEGESFARYRTDDFASFDEEYVKGPVYDGTGRSYCLVEPNVVIEGPADVLTSIIERHGPAKFSDELTTAIDSADLSKPIAIVGSFMQADQPAADIPDNPVTQALYRCGKSITGHVSFDGDVSVTLNLVCRDVKSARQVQQMAQGGLAMLRFDPGAPKEALVIIDLIQLQVDDSSVVGKVTVPADAMMGMLALEMGTSDEPTRYGRSLAKLIEQLDSEDAKDRKDAVSDLREFGPEAKPAVPKLAKLLSDENSDVQIQAALALQQIGHDASEALPALIEATRDPDSDVREYALQAMGKIGAQHPGVVPALIRTLHDEDESVVSYTISSLGYLGPDAAPAVPALVEMIDQQRYILLALRQIGPGAEAAVPVLLARVRNGDGDLDDLGRALARISEDAIEPLIEALSDPDADVRQRAAQVLGYYGKRAAPAVPALMEAASDQFIFVRSAAVRSLGEIGADAAKQALPRVIESLNDGVDSAAFALEKFGPAAAPATAALLERLSYSVSRDDQPVIRALGSIGPGARQALPRLRELLERQLASRHEFFSKDEVTISIAQAIAKIDPNAFEPVVALTILARDLDSYKSEKTDAVRALGELGPAAASAVPILVELLGEDSALREDLKEEIVATLGKIGSNARDAVPALIAVLPERRGVFRGEISAKAAEALGRIGPVSPDVIGALIRTVKAGGYESTSPAILALAEIGPPAKFTVPLFEDLLRDEHHRMAAATALFKLDGQIDAPLRIARRTLRDFSEFTEERLMAIELIVEMGSHARPAVEELLLAAKSHDDQLRNAANAALAVFDRENY